MGAERMMSDARYRAVIVRSKREGLSYYFSQLANIRCPECGSKSKKTFYELTLEKHQLKLDMNSYMPRLKAVEFHKCKDCGAVYRGVD